MFLNVETTHSACSKQLRFVFPFVLAKRRSYLFFKVEVVVKQLDLW